MIMREQKKFFKRLTEDQIIKLSSVREISDNLVEQILGLQKNQAVIIKKDLYSPEKFQDPRKFLKYGGEVKIKRYKSLDDVLKSEERKTPVQLREMEFDKISNKPFSRYTVKPFAGTDKRTRIFYLNNCTEGARIYSYADKNPKGCPEITIEKAYKDTTGVAKYGAEIITRVPSRTEGQERYKIKFSSVPVVDNDKKWEIANGIFTDHVCENKRYTIRHPHISNKEDSKQIKFCEHEVAGYLEIIHNFWDKEKNVVPLQMSQFAIPSQLTANYYMNLLNNCLIQTSKDKKPRRLNEAETEVMLWGLVYKIGHDKTFYSDIRIDGPLKDYKWRAK